MNYDRMIVVEVKIELKETCAQGVSNTIIIVISVAPLHRNIKSLHIPKIPEACQHLTMQVALSHSFSPVHPYHKLAAV